MNGTALDGAVGDIFYSAPDTLAWEDLQIGYGAFVHWALDGDLDAFYAHLRWPGWERETEQLGGDQALSLYPPPWTSEGKDLARVSRGAVPAREVWGVQQEFAQRLRVGAV